MSLIWLSIKKSSESKRIEMVINFSVRRDEAYRAARRGERQDKIEEKKGGIRD